MDDLISVTCRLMQNFASQGWATKEGTSKSQIPLQDVLYGSVDMFSRHTVAWESVSAEEGDLDHPPGTSRPDAHASATQGMVKPDRATANHAPGAPGKDEVLWELVYFFDNMDNPAGTPRKETGDPCFTRQHLVATFMDLISHLPSRGYEALAPSLTVPHPAQFFQGIAEQGYVWQTVPYGIDFTGDIGVYGRSGTFWSWGKAQRGAWFAALCHDDPDRRLGLVCVRMADGNTRGATASLHDPTPARRASGADARISSVLPLFRVAGFPTHAGLAADPGIQVYVADPQPPSPAPILPWELADPNPPRCSLTHCTLPCMRGTRQCRPGPPLARQSPGGGTVLPPPAPTGPSSAGHPACDTAPLWLPAPPHTGADVCGRDATTEARRLSKQARSASRGPPGEDMQAVRLSEPHPIAGGRPTPLFDTLNSALLHVIQRAAHSGGLSLGECECVVTRLHGMPAPPQGFLGVVTHLRSLADQMSLAPWDFNPQGDGVLPWLLPWVCVLISWVREDMRVAPGSDHQGAIVNMYLELSRMEWWALSDRHEVLSEWCKGASMPV
ncbi:hypothetical protein K439DRAFT_1624289 [Ramaria rubella]|nr:hypothetical protein K439DRAFT_1624289 [Ramaria rubella]